MKYFVYLIVVSLFVFMISCENEKHKNDNKEDICSDTILIIGDQNDASVNIAAIDTFIYSGSSNYASYVYFIDLDSDQINDFRLVSSFEHSAMLYWKVTVIESLNSFSKVAVNDTIDYPEILGIGDTLYPSNKWISGNLLFLDYTGSFQLEKKSHFMFVEIG